MWYYEYELNICNFDDGEGTVVRGIVAANSYAEAMESIEDYYGEDILDILLITCVSEYVYEFNCEDARLSIQSKRKEI